MPTDLALPVPISATPDRGCDWIGCDAAAVAVLTQKVGQRQQLACCDEHLPAWAKPGAGGSAFYTVERIGA